MSEVPPAALPAGAKDVLAVEAQELREVEAALRERFTRYGYREVMTPVLEFADVIDRAQEGGLREAFRLFDDHGRVLVLRPDLTIPVARLVATRMADHPGPVRAFYLARAFRPVPEGRPRASEQRQAGVELVGANGPGADAEAIALLADSLAATGLEGLRIGVADVSLTAAVLEGVVPDPEARAALRAALAARDLAGWRRLARGVGEPTGLLERLPTLRGGAEALDRLGEAVPQAATACEGLRRTLGLVGEHGAAGAVVIDLGVMRDWPYYSGVVYEAYAPGVGEPVAMGGRYDGLAGRFGRARPAVGFGIALDALHRALMAAGSADPPPREGVVMVGGLDEDPAGAAAARRAGLAVVALAASDDDLAEDLAEAEGWRFVARRSGTGYAVLDRATGERRSGVARLEEALPSPG
ncbi:MAG TPA: ATP phosphoribosyltransferase regulatory subunit [Miltoncostaeaceae bacterium]|nr:ATP phosphoribosyltransferase regulatory subunit [Miltoncostaeaceae bacterium]